MDENLRQAEGGRSEETAVAYSRGEPGQFRRTHVASFRGSKWPFIQRN
jgi:hypothetical protein